MFGVIGTGGGGLGTYLPLAGGNMADGAEIKGFSNGKLSVLFDDTSQTLSISSDGQNSIFIQLTPTAVAMVQGVGQIGIINGQLFASGTVAFAGDAAAGVAGLVTGDLFRLAATNALTVKI